jgi:hypothetical protein
VRRLALVLGPLAAGALVLLLVHRLYPSFLVAATEALRALWPATPPPASVTATPGGLKVGSPSGGGFVAAGGVGWNLAALACLWGWVARGRLPGLLLASLLLVALHVFVAEVEIRRRAGGISGFPYEFLRAWHAFGAALLPVALAAVGRAWPPRRVSPGVAPSPRGAPPP